MDDWLRSDAIEGAAVMIYAVSLAYKESSNCRLEANYAHQQELDMMPLMMTKGKTLFLQSPHLMVTFGPPLADIVFVRFGLSERMCLLLRVRVITIHYRVFAKGLARSHPWDEAVGKSTSRLLLFVCVSRLF